MRCDVSGFVVVYRLLHALTDGGTNIRFAQYLFIGLYVSFTIVIATIYERARPVSTHSGTALTIAVVVGQSLTVIPRSIDRSVRRLCRRVRRGLCYYCVYQSVFIPSLCFDSLMIVSLSFSCNQLTLTTAHRSNDPHPITSISSPSVDPD